MPVPCTDKRSELNVEPWYKDKIYSKQIFFTVNIQESTVFHLTSKVRSDGGGENVDVARAMITVRGAGRRSHITGSSVHNQ